MEQSYVESDPVLSNMRRLLAEWTWLCGHRCRFRVKPPSIQPGVSDDVLYHPYPTQSWMRIGLASNEEEGKLVEDTGAVGVSIHVYVDGHGGEVAILNFVCRPDQEKWGQHHWMRARWWVADEPRSTSLTKASAGLRGAKGSSLQFSPSERILKRALASYMSRKLVDGEREEQILLGVLAYLRSGPVSTTKAHIMFTCRTQLYALRNQAEQVEFSPDGGQTTKKEFYLERKAEWDLRSAGPDAGLRTTLILRHKSLLAP